jgi:hypothetical protein
MKTGMTLLVALTAFAVVADGGLAGKKPSPAPAAPTAVQCKAPRAAVLTGTFVAAGEASFTMDVARTNAHPRSLAGKKGLEVKLDASTKLVRRGASARLDQLVAGDRLNVQGRLCKGTDAAAASLLARRVVARPKAAEA